jgi:hypothetical protein
MTLLAQLAVLLAAVTEPAGACRVQLLPGDAPRAWSAAAASLQRQLRAGPAGDHDCRDVIVRAGAREASVEVTTADGRRAVRTLADAADLEPTVAALVVTLPPDPSPGTPPAATVPATAMRPERTWRVLAYAGGGARLTLPRTPAPLLELMVGTLHRRWEVALFAGWAPSITSTGGAGGTAGTQGDGSATGEIGLVLARRQPVRFGDLLIGGRAGAMRLAAATNGADAMTTGNNEDPTGAAVAPAVAAFVGSAVRIGSMLRLRPQLALQWLPPPRAGGPNAPSTWSLGLTLGAESSVP